MDAFSASDVERFWSKVIKSPSADGHWFWLGAIADDGYGRFTINHHGRTDAVRPHRYAYALAHQLGLNEFGTLMHDCDVPICVRPEPGHLTAGTQRDNMLDRQRKGRDTNGSQFKWRGLPRQQFANSSRVLRDELKTYGFTRPTVLEALLSGNDPEAPTLF